MNKSILLIMFLIITFNGFSQYPVVIDSILVNYIGNDKVLIVDNKIGERLEFYFDDHGKIIEENYFCLFDDNDSIVLFGDSTKRLKDEMTTISFTYDIQSKKIIEIDTLPPNCRINNKIVISDSIFWTVGCSQYLSDHVLVSKEKLFTFYKSTLTMDSGRKYVDEWRIKYEEEKVFLFNENYSTAYVIFLKNEIPFKIEKHSTSSYRNELNMQQTFIDKLNKSNPSLTYVIYYGDNKKKPFNDIMSKKTISLYKKYIGLE